MTESYVVHHEPELDAPVLLIALQGWVDAGMAMDQAINAITSQSPPEVLVDFNADHYIDYRARRPILEMSDGVLANLRWPKIELCHLQDLDGHDILLLRGYEPDNNWRDFTSAVVELAHQFGVTRGVTLGAYPSTVPHTRPTKLTSTATTSMLIDPTAVVPGRIELQGGAVTALEFGLADAGIPAMGIWAQVPHYAASLEYPDAAVTLLRAFHTRVNYRFDTKKLEADALTTRTQIDELIGRNTERRNLVVQLEKMHDEFGLAGDLPTGDELAADFQDFLRETNPDEPT
jgi:hypothetical protein